jgi:hypothetical protein
MESTSSRESDTRYQRREHSVPQAPNPVPYGRCQRRAGTCYGGSVGSFLSPALVLILYPAIDLPITLLAPLLFSRLQYSLLDYWLRKRVDTPSTSLSSSSPHSWSHACHTRCWILDYESVSTRHRCESLASLTDATTPWATEARSSMSKACRPSRERAPPPPSNLPPHLWRLRQPVRSRSQRTRCLLCLGRFVMVSTKRCSSPSRLSYSHTESWKMIGATRKHPCSGVVYHSFLRTNRFTARPLGSLTPKTPLRSPKAIPLT